MQEEGLALIGSNVSTLPYSLHVVRSSFLHLVNYELSPSTILTLQLILSVLTTVYHLGVATPFTLLRLCNCGPIF
jgi:hypothetical protein